jgi:hypothetical protein
MSMHLMRGSSPQRVVLHLPNIATLRRGTHLSTCTDVVWCPRPVVLSPALPLTSWVSMFYFMESATIIIFFVRGCEKEYSLYACDNDEKDGRPLKYIVNGERISSKKLQCRRNYAFTG